MFILFAYITRKSSEIIFNAFQRPWLAEVRANIQFCLNYNFLKSVGKRRIVTSNGRLSCALFASGGEAGHEWDTLFKGIIYIAARWTWRIATPCMCMAARTALAAKNPSILLLKTFLFSMHSRNSLNDRGQRP